MVLESGLPYWRGEPNHAGRTCEKHDATRDSVQADHGTAVLVWSGFAMGRGNGADQEFDPGYAAEQADASTEGDV